MTLSCKTPWWSGIQPPHGKNSTCPCALLLLSYSKSYNNILYASVQFSSSVMYDSVTPWTTACQASLSLIISWNLLKFTSIESGEAKCRCLAYERGWEGQTMPGLMSHIKKCGLFLQFSTWYTSTSSSSSLWCYSSPKAVLIGG